MYCAYKYLNPEFILFLLYFLSPLASGFLPPGQRQKWGSYGMLKSCSLVLRHSRKTMSDQQNHSGSDHVFSIAWLETTEHIRFYD